MPGKPYKPAKVLKLIKALRAEWITEGVSAQLLYWSDAELEADNRRTANRKIQDASDKVVHKGHWQVIHADLNYESSERPLTSGWQLPHPRPTEPPILSPVMEVSA